MIAYLQGTVLALHPDAGVILVGGVGYAVALPTGVLESLQIDQDVQLHTYQHVREDSVELYGFADRDQLGVFEQLLGVSGIGPRSALAFLSSFSPIDIRQAIRTHDTAVLSSVPGIGKKTAERIILDLRDAIADSEEVSAVAATPGRADVLEALQSLGYSVVESRHALQNIDQSVSVEEQVRQALQLLSQ